MMRWERLEINKGGPGKRWGHTCNAVRGGQLLYIFGGYDEDNTQTNKVHVFDATTSTWSEPDMQRTLPAPRDSHSCTTVGDKLFVFGGTNGNVPFKDLHILDTSTNTWMAPYVRDGPEAREGHKTMVWERVATTGIPPAKRNSHTCVSWKNKIILIGGEDTQNYYLSDVQMLDTDTLAWTNLVTNGETLPPRAGHTTIALRNNLYVFGGFSDCEDLYDDLYLFDLETFTWTKVTTVGVGPSARFSMAGGTLHPQLGGVLVFIGGFSRTLAALDDMYYLHTDKCQQYSATPKATTDKGASSTKSPNPSPERFSNSHPHYQDLQRQMIKSLTDDIQKDCSIARTLQEQVVELMKSIEMKNEMLENIKKAFV